jgi:hypothetical protein
MNNMIVIVMITAEEKAALLFDSVISQKDKLQKALNEGGRLLYITKRKGENGASLILHLKDPQIITDLISGYLGQIKGVLRIWVMPLFRPRFFPLPKDTKGMKRFVITLKVASDSFTSVYKHLLNPNMPDGLKKVYYAYTFQLYDNAMQLSLLADNDAILKKYITEKISAIPGVLKTSIYEIEQTKPFITYDEWQAYAGEKVPHSKWENMLTHIEGWDI